LRLHPVENPFSSPARLSKFVFTGEEVGRTVTTTLKLPTMGNLKKKRRLKMNKHKRRKRLKANRHKKRTWQK
jgi:hypothetical protein